MSNQEKSIQKSTGYWITRLARCMEQDFKQRLKPLGITRGAYAVLSAIHHDKKTRPAELAGYLGLDGAAITRYLDQVEKSGLIERTPHAADRRSTQLHVTPDGRKVVSQGLSSSKATNDKYMAGLSTTEIECFQTAIRAMLAKSDITVTSF